MRPLCIALVVLSSFQIAALFAEEPIEGIPVERPAAKPAAITPELVAAHHAYRQAKLNLHQYRFVAQPEKRRQLNDQIALAEAEIDLLKRRLRDYRPFLEVDEFSPVETAAESHQLALLEAQQRLRRLKRDKLALLRLNRQSNELYRLDVLHAAARLIEVRRFLSQQSKEQ